MSADAIVKSFIDRILRLKEEQDTLAADIREVYAEAKGNGYDKTAMGAVVAHLRKIEKHGADACEERDAAFGLYLDAYERATGTGLATHTHETIPPHDTETGEITEHEQPETPAEEIHERPSTNDKAYLEAVPQDEASLAGTGSRMLAGREGRHEGEAASACLPTHSQSAETSPAADKPETVVTPLPAVSGNVPEGIPAFLLKERKPLRPNCLNPDNCAGYGSHTCHSCTRAMAESVVAA